VFHSANWRAILLAVGCGLTNGRSAQPQAQGISLMTNLAARLEAEQAMDATADALEQVQAEWNAAQANAEATNTVLGFDYRPFVVRRDAADRDHQAAIQRFRVIALSCLETA
jgi:hypothetical protein